MKKQAKEFKSVDLDDILASISPEEQKRTDNRMLIAAKIDDAIKARGWKKKDFMNAVGQRNQSVISKWLSGTHNFTTDTLTDIEGVLNVNLLNTNQEIKAKPDTYCYYVKQKQESSRFDEVVSKPYLKSKKTKVISLVTILSNNSEIAQA